MHFRYKSVAPTWGINAEFTLFRDPGEPNEGKGQDVSTRCEHIRAMTPGAGSAAGSAALSPFALLGAFLGALLLLSAP